MAWACWDITLYCSAGTSTSSSPTPTLIRSRSRRYSRIFSPKSSIATPWEERSLMKTNAGQNLLQQSFRISETASRCLGDLFQILVVDLCLFSLHNLLELLHNQSDRGPFKSKPLATGANRFQKPMGFSRCQNKNRVGRRLLQSLEKGVGGIRCQHVGFVNDIDLVPADGRGEPNLFPERADILNPPIGSGIDLDQVQVASLFNLFANSAGSIRFPGFGVFAVDGLGEDAGGCGLAGAARASEEISVGDLAIFNLTLKGILNSF